MRTETRQRRPAGSRRQRRPAGSRRQHRPAGSRRRDNAACSAAPRLAVALTLPAVALQLAYPLLTGTVRDAVTVAVVLLLAAAAVAHAAATRGAGFAAAVLAVTAGGGFAVEQVGVHTGVPFGTYSYGAGIGPTWAGVPPLVALAWTMLAWPAVVTARTIARRRADRIVLGALALAGTDLFLDPQMVRAGYWAWHFPDPHLPGVATVPLTNFAGWLLAAALLSLALNLMLDARERRGSPTGAADLLPGLLYCWLCLGWVVALAGFLRLPAAGGWGALVTVPIVATWVRRAARAYR